MVQRIVVVAVAVVMAVDRIKKMQQCSRPTPKLGNASKLTAKSLAVKNGVTFKNNHPLPSTSEAESRDWQSGLD
jgi:hypothetical protein